MKIGDIGVEREEGEDCTYVHLTWRLIFKVFALHRKRTVHMGYTHHPTGLLVALFPPSRADSTSLTKVTM